MSWMDYGYQPYNPQTITFSSEITIDAGDEYPVSISVAEEIINGILQPSQSTTPSTGSVTDVIMPSILVLTTGFVATLLVLQGKKRKYVV